jgi:hypothetical protein
VLTGIVCFKEDVLSPSCLERSPLSLSLNRIGGTQHSTENCLFST